jgi:hypothetical protein
MRFKEMRALSTDNGSESTQSVSREVRVFQFRGPSTGVVLKSLSRARAAFKKGRDKQNEKALVKKNLNAWRKQKQKLGNSVEVGRVALDPSGAK